MTDAVKPQSCAVLFVDDEVNILKSLRRLMMDEVFEVFTASSGEEGLELLTANQQIGVIVSDQRMPGLTGVDFLQRTKDIRPDAIKILLTGYSDINATIDAINKAGALRYLNKPWRDDELLQVVREAVKRHDLEQENARLAGIVAKQNEELKDWNAQLEYYVQQQTIDLQNQNRELTRLTERIHSNFRSIILSFANLIELRDRAVRNHSRNVAEIAARTAKAMGLSAKDVEAITVAGLLHDIGKIGSTDTMLIKKMGEFNEEEIKEYKLHPIRGQTAIDGIEDLRPTGRLIRHHHENFDGSGFPDGLAGDKIPLGARLIAVADFLDRSLAVTVLPDKEGLHRLLDPESGTKLDPKLIGPLIPTALDFFEKNVPKADMREKELKPEDLRDGMIVSRDVRSGSGLLLLSKGVTLDKVGIDSLVHHYHSDPARSGIFVWVKS